MRPIPGCTCGCNDFVGSKDEPEPVRTVWTTLPDARTPVHRSGYEATFTPAPHGLIIERGVFVNGDDWKDPKYQPLDTAGLPPRCVVVPLDAFEDSYGVVDGDDAIKDTDK